MGIVRGELVQFLFSTQTLETQSLLPKSEEYTILSLDVTTTEAGQRVKLDSMALLKFLTTSTGVGYTVDARYELYRDDILISFFNVQDFNSKPDNFIIEKTLQPNLTWVDVPPAPGTYTYEVRIFTDSLTSNLQSFTAETARALNAIVFRPEVITTRRLS